LGKGKNLPQSFTEEEHGVSRRREKAEFLHYRKRFKRGTSVFDLGVGSALG
jgi:hypothetical protein